MMTEWFQKSIDALNLNGKAERTQEAYTRALRMPCEFYRNKPPKAITEAELEAYFLRRKNVDRWSSNTMRICYCGIRFYFVNMLQGNPSVRRLASNGGGNRICRDPDRMRYTLIHYPRFQAQGIGQVFPDRLEIWHPGATC